MIALIGIAGSGKSTQRQLLAGQLHCPWIYTGELLRANLTGDNKADLKAGKIIDDAVTIPLLQADLIKKNAAEEECILDGSPRTTAQAEWFAGLVKRGEVKLSGIIHLVISPAEALRRLQGRERTDDSPQAIAERFRVYQTLTVPVLDYLAAQGLTVQTVSAAGAPEEVNRRILQAIGQPAGAAA